MNSFTNMAYPFLYPEDLRPDVRIAAAQNGIACWSRAWTQVAHGLMSAGVAQVDLARSLCAAAPVDWANGITREARHDRLHATRGRFETAVNGYRKIHDELLVSLFGAAEILVDAWPATPPAGAAATADEARTAPADGASSATTAARQKTAA